MLYRGGVKAGAAAREASRITGSARSGLAKRPVHATGVTGSGKSQVIRDIAFQCALDVAQRNRPGQCVNQWRVVQKGLLRPHMLGQKSAAAVRLVRIQNGTFR